MNSFQTFSFVVAKKDLVLKKVRLFAFVLFLQMLVACESRSLDDQVNNKATQINNLIESTEAHILSVDEPIWNMGEVVVKGGKIDFDHEFVLKNNSSTDVEILKVKSTCGCLAAKDYRRHIHPGETSNIKVTMSVFGPPGPFERQVTVVTEGESGIVEMPLIVKGQRAVSDMLYITPNKFTFGNIPQGKVRTRIISLARFDGTPVLFDRFETSSPALRMLGDGEIDFRSDPFDKQIECIEVTVELDTTKLPVGNFLIPVTLTTSHQVTDGSDQITEGVTSIQTNAVGRVVPPQGPWVSRLILRNLLPSEKIEISLVRPDYSGLVPCIDQISFHGAEQLTFILSEKNSKNTKNAEQGQCAQSVYAVINDPENIPPVMRGKLEITTTPKSKEPIVIPVLAFPPSKVTRAKGT